MPRVPKPSSKSKEIKNSAAVSQASVQAAGKMDQDLKDLAKLRQEVLLVAQCLEQPFTAPDLEEKYGKPLPFEKFDFSSLLNFLCNHPALARTWSAGKVRFNVRKPGFQQRDLENLRQRVLEAARSIVSPFSYLSLLDAYSFKFEERLRTNTPKSIVEFVAGIPEIEVIDASKGMFRVVGWDPRRLRQGSEYKAVQDEIYEVALCLVAPFSSHTLSEFYEDMKKSEIPFEKFGFLKLTAFLEEHPRIGKIDKGREECYFPKKDGSAVPPQNRGIRVPKGSKEKSPAPVAAKKILQEEEYYSSDGSSSDESVVEIPKPDEESLPLKKATPDSRLAGQKQAKGQKASAKGKESSTDSSDSDSPPVSKKQKQVKRVAKGKKDESSTDSDDDVVPLTNATPASLVAGQKELMGQKAEGNKEDSHLDEIIAEVLKPVKKIRATRLAGRKQAKVQKAEDNLASGEGALFAPLFNLMAYPPPTMLHQMQDIPVPPTKKGLLGEMVARVLDEAEGEGQDSNDLTQDSMKAVSTKRG